MRVVSSTTGVWTVIENEEIWVLRPYEIVRVLMLREI